jgi:hypothetical protein
MILTINSDYYSINRLVSVKEMGCFLWGTDWNVKYYLDDYQASIGRRTACCALFRTLSWTKLFITLDFAHGNAWLTSKWLISIWTAPCKVRNQASSLWATRRKAPLHDKTSQIVTSAKTPFEISAGHVCTCSRSIRFAFIHCYTLQPLWDGYQITVSLCTWSTTTWWNCTQGDSAV